MPRRKAIVISEESEDVQKKKKFRDEFKIMHEFSDDEDEDDEEEMSEVDDGEDEDEKENEQKSSTKKSFHGAQKFKRPRKMREAFKSTRPEIESQPKITRKKNKAQENQEKDTASKPFRISSDASITREEIDHSKARAIADTLVHVVNGQFIVKRKALDQFLSNEMDSNLIAMVLEHLPFTVLDPATRDTKIKSVAKQHHIDLEYVVDCCMKRCEFLERKRSIKQDKNGLEVKDVASMLTWLPVYSQVGPAFATFRTRALTPKELEHPRGPDVQRLAVGQQSVMSTFGRFKRNLEAFCKVPLSSLQLNAHTLLMGGAVVACLRRLPPELEKLHATVEIFKGDFLARRLPNVLVVSIQQFLDTSKREQELLIKLEDHYDQFYHDSDVDIFMSVDSIPSRQTKSVAWASQFNQNLQELVEVDKAEKPRERQEHHKEIRYVKEAHKWVKKDFLYYPLDGYHPDKASMYYVRTPNALTVVGLDPYRNIQIIACERRRPIDLLMDFDLDACGAAFDGNQVWVLPRTRRALNTQTNFVDPFVIRFLRNRRRLAKYDERQFQMLLFEACRHSPRCDVQPNVETSDWWELCIRTVNAARASAAAKEGTWLRKESSADPRFVPGPDFKPLRYQDPKLKFGRIADDFGFASNSRERFANPRCSLCVMVGEPILHAQQRVCVPLIEHEKGHLQAFFSRIYGREIKFEDMNGLCDAHINQYRSTHTKAWLERRSRDVEEEDGPLSPAQPSADDRLLQFDLLTHDGLVYPDEHIPVRALNKEQIMHRMKEQIHADRELHVRLYGQTVPFIPRIEHGDALEDLWSIELRERARPPIGRNPERIMNLCYMCGLDITDGEFTDRLCRSCATINQQARDLTADLTGRVALITGARAKLGFECAVKLLRCGTTVIGLTRFPRAALVNYRMLPDYKEWKQRLFLHGVDMRQTPAVMSFVEMFANLHRRLDIIINNAAQTVRRPPAYYYELVQKEQTLPPLGLHEWATHRTRAAAKDVDDITQKMIIAQKFIDKVSEFGVDARFHAIFEGKSDPLLPHLTLLQDHPWLNEFVTIENKTVNQVNCIYRARKSQPFFSTTLAIPIVEADKLTEFVEKQRNAAFLAAPREPLCTFPLTTEQLNSRQTPPCVVIKTSSSTTTNTTTTTTTTTVASSSKSSSSSSPSSCSASCSASCSSANSDSSSFPSPLLPSFPIALPSAPYLSPFALPGDLMVRDDAWFPPGAVDRHGEQLDLRPHTSWNARISQVNVLEMLEVQFVNVVAPYLLVSALGPLIRDGAVSHPRFIINVSSQEGQFHTELPKKSFHPHTNMAKAALNMLTRTTAVEFMQDNVSVLSVDPGWVSDMRPTTRVKLDKLPRQHEDTGTSSQVKRVSVAPPLSVADGAARILHPILEFTNITRCPPYGVLLKNFKVEPW